MTQEKAKQMKQPLPSGPSTLCFNKEEFMRYGFNVEQFVVECRRRVPLETLRDDLGVYLKILQSAMIELINKDYADFVNLSTNLVGLDKAINSLMYPLNQLKSEVLVVRGALDDAIRAIDDKMLQKAEIRERKSCMKRLINILQCVQKMESLLGIGETGQQEDHESQLQRSDTDSSGRLSGPLIERVATEFNKLQFYVNKSRGLPLVEDIKPRIASITTTLQYGLEGSFKEGLDLGNTEILRQCLRTYATIDKMRDAENLFRQFVVKPYMEDTITEQFMAGHPQGLQGMLAVVLEFIPTHCKKLKHVTSGSAHGGGEVVRGYDFLVNSVWPEIISNVEARVPSIFAPGNPNVFHDKYLISMDFVENFERQCGSQASVKRLRAHPSYNTFMSKWSLPVYFQIRFQEIAGAFETCLTSAFNPASDTTLFQLHATHCLWGCLHHCWEQEIYLQPLCHRFWKLSLQLMSRYSTWATEVYDTEVQSKKESAAKAEPGLPRNASMPALGAALDQVGGAANGEGLQRKETMAVLPKVPEVTVAQVVALIADAQMLAVMLPDFFSESVKPHMVALGLTNLDVLEESLQEASAAITGHIPLFGDSLAGDMTEQCCAPLRTVSDLPRLYRRTNRDVPSKPSGYVATLVKPVKQFLREHKSAVSEDIQQQWLRQVVVAVASHYFTVTSDVLTSVRKMEESLKRLKRGKASAGSQGMSDDDKIRLQLYLDVKQLGSEIESLGLEVTSLEAYSKLVELVESAKNGNGST